MWSKNSEFSAEADIWFLEFFEHVKYDNDVHFFCFRLLCKFFPKNPYDILMLPY